MTNLKVGDKLIYTSQRYSKISRIAIVTIVKENKETFKLSDDKLVYKDGLRVRESREKWSSTYEQYVEYDVNEWKRLKDDMLEHKYETWKNSIEKQSLNNIEMMKRYIEENKGTIEEM